MEVDGFGGSGSGMHSEGPTDYKLTANHELRVEVASGKSATIKLVSGTAEMFGTELTPGHSYEVHVGSRAVYTWTGCHLQISGLYSSAYVAEETPMPSYMYAHAALEDLREAARVSGGDGPRVAVVGPVDVGKSTICRILAGYAVRSGHKVLYVDLDIGQNQITVPGAVAAVVMEQCFSIVGEELRAPPLAFYHAATSPGERQELFRKQVELLAQHCIEKCASSTRLKRGGMIINTCGWVENQGFALIVHHLMALQVDVVLVVGDDRLYSNLCNHYERAGMVDTVAVRKLDRSGGVVPRPQTLRSQSRDARIARYFYGFSRELSPHSTTVSFDSLTVFRIGGDPRAPQDVLPVGARSAFDPFKLQEVPLTEALNNCLLAVVHAESPEEVVTANVASFVHVQSVKPDKRQITLLSPSPDPLPTRYALVGDIKWLDV